LILKTVPFSEKPLKKKRNL